VQIRMITCHAQKNIKDQITESGHFIVDSMEEKTGLDILSASG